MSQLRIILLHPWNFVMVMGLQKTEWCPQQTGKKVWHFVHLFRSNTRHWTQEQTDGNKWHNIISRSACITCWCM